MIPQESGNNGLQESSSGVMEHPRKHSIKRKGGFCVLLAWKAGDPETVGDVVAEAASWPDSWGLEGFSFEKLMIYQGQDEAVTSKVRRDLSQLALEGQVKAVVFAGGQEALGPTRAFAEQLGIRVFEKPRRAMGSTDTSYG